MPSTRSCSSTDSLMDMSLPIDLSLHSSAGTLADGIDVDVDFDTIDNFSVLPNPHQPAWDFASPTIDFSPPTRGLYSTPQIWEPSPPHMAPQGQILATLQAQLAAQYQVPVPSRPSFQPVMSTLSQAQQEKLCSIAMPDHLQSLSLASMLHSTNPSRPKVNASPTLSEDVERHGTKRKSSTELGEEDDENSDEAHPTVRKAAHNMIEKRYRTNLNDKIAALRDSVPSLRYMAKSANGGSVSTEGEDLEGLKPAHKLNKATILAKATEYIRHLEKRSKKLVDENATMKARIVAFEKLFVSGSLGFAPMHPLADHNHNDSDTHAYQADPSSSDISPLGMIAVPDDIRRMNSQAQEDQQIYHPDQSYVPLQQQQGWAGNGYFGKMMVGTLAGLMLLEGLNDSNAENQDPDTRDLSSMPMNRLRMISRALLSKHQIDLSMFKLILALGMLLFILISFVVSGSDGAPRKKPAYSSIIPAPSVASPIHVRRQAWLTSIQTVWVPRHSFFLEAAALILKTIKLSMRHAIGYRLFALLTGTTEQQEAARVKAWSIALDAQLGGGDSEISKSRLTLTMLASGTLPDAPDRLMMKALHMRVLLWDTGNGASRVQRYLAKLLARWKWNEARQLQKLIKCSSRAEFPSDMESLPEHLGALLELDCNDVLCDPIVLRAYSLAWNKPVVGDELGLGSNMDVVVADFAIRSPLDALAAWFSTLVLHDTIKSSLSSTGSEGEVTAGINIAVTVAPPGSSAQACALVARAVLSNTNKAENVIAASDNLENSPASATFSNAPDNLFISSTLSPSTISELRFALGCAIAIASIQEAPTGIQAIQPIISSLKVSVPSLSLVGFAAAYRFMLTLAENCALARQHRITLAGLAGTLCNWAAGPAGLALQSECRESVIDACNKVSKIPWDKVPVVDHEIYSTADSVDGLRPSYARGAVSMSY